jgi:hypothetical protein
MTWSYRQLLDCDQALASVETAATPEQAWALHGGFMDQYIASRRGQAAASARRLLHL